MISARRRYLVWVGLGFAVTGGVAAAFLNRAEETPQPVLPLLVRGRLVSRVQGVTVGLRRVHIAPARPHTVRAHAHGTDAAITDFDGYFEFRGGWTGQAYIYADSPPDESWTCRPVGPIPLPDAEPIQIELVRGSQVRGRLVANGKPLPGQTLILTSAESETMAGVLGLRVEATTDENGRFTYAALLEKVPVSIFNRLGGLPDWLVVPSIHVTTGEDGQSIDLGEVEARPGLTIRGRIVWADGRPINRRWKVEVRADELMSRGRGSLKVATDDLGCFVVQGVPPGPIFITPSLESGQDVPPQYHLSDLMPGVDPRFDRRIVGRIDRDVNELTILMEPDTPGKPSARTHSSEEFERARDCRIEGIETRR